MISLFPLQLYQIIIKVPVDFPVQYTAFQQGQSTEITVSSVTDTKAPAGTFGIAPDFDKISKDDLAAMSGGR